MKITVSKEELLGKLTDNRDKHREVFEDALEGYYKAVGDWAQEQVKRARQHKSPTYFPGRSPQDHTEDYNRVIGMLGMHTGSEFTLDEREYAQYVDDNWSWTGEWRASASAYSIRNDGKFSKIYGEIAEEDDD